VLIETGTDPVRNLSLEDQLLQEVEDGTRPESSRLWVSDRCLVRGPNRSCRSGWHLEEVADRLGVSILPRSTGGGTVYHDPGNLNWSFYLRRAEGFVGAARLFRAAAALVLEGLAALGIEGRFAPPNRIDVADRKVSGLASRASLGAVLVHGTLLVATDLEPLNALCIPPPGCPPVVNLRDLRPGLTVPVVRQVLAEVIHGRRFPDLPLAPCP